MHSFLLPHLEAGGPVCAPQGVQQASEAPRKIRIRVRQRHGTFGAQGKSGFAKVFSGNEVLLRLQGETTFWRRKIRTFHGLIDVNKDGVISYDDFRLLTDRFVSLGHLSEQEAYELQEIIKVTSLQ